MVTGVNTTGENMLDIVYARVYITVMETTNAPTNHATERAMTRIAAAGLSGRKVLAASAAIASKCPAGRSVAVKLTTLPEHVGSTNEDFYARTESNGNQVWVIIRDRRVVTLMLRRDNQPETADAMRVDIVTALPNA